MSERAILSDLSAIPVVEKSVMDGAKTAVMLEGTLCVSPAMMNLMKTATEDELQHLLKNLPLIDLGKMPSVRDPWPIPMLDEEPEESPIRFRFR